MSRCSTWRSASEGGSGFSIYGFMVNHRKSLIESITQLPCPLFGRRPRGSERPCPAGGELLRAPFSGLPCVFFTYHVEARRESAQRDQMGNDCKGNLRGALLRTR